MDDLNIGFTAGIVLTLVMVFIFWGLSLTDIKYYYVTEEGHLGISHQCNKTDDISICEIDNKLIVVDYFESNKED